VQGEESYCKGVLETTSFKLVGPIEKNDISFSSPFSIRPLTGIDTSNVHNQQVSKSQFISPTSLTNHDSSLYNSSHSHRIAQSPSVTFSVESPTISISSPSLIPTVSHYSPANNDSPALTQHSNAHSMSLHSPSIFTLTSTTQPWIRIGSFVNHHPVTILIDSGGSGNFVSSTFVQRHSKIKAQPSNSTVALADGTTRPTSIVKSATIRIMTYTDGIDFVVCPLVGYDVILGTPWLSHYNPNIDWERHEVLFVDEHGESQFHSDVSPTVTLSLSSAPLVPSSRLTTVTQSSDPVLVNTPSNEVKEHSSPSSSNLNVRNEIRKMHMSPSHSSIMTPQQVRRASKKHELVLISISAYFVYTDTGATLDIDIDNISHSVNSVTSSHSVESESLASASTAIIAQYRDVFTESLPHGSPASRKTGHRIELIRQSIPSRPTYRQSVSAFSELKSEPAELVQLGFIQPLNSPNVVTDPQSSQYFKTQPQFLNRQIHIISKFDFEIVDIKGRTTIVADRLFRRLDHVDLPSLVPLVGADSLGVAHLSSSSFASYPFSHGDSSSLVSESIDIVSSCAITDSTRSSIVVASSALVDSSLSSLSDHVDLMSLVPQVGADSLGVAHSSLSSLAAYHFGPAKSSPFVSESINVASSRPLIDSTRADSLGVAHSSSSWDHVDLLSLVPLVGADSFGVAHSSSLLVAYLLGNANSSLYALIGADSLEVAYSLSSLACLLGHVNSSQLASESIDIASSHALIDTTRSSIVDAELAAVLVDSSRSSSSSSVIPNSNSVVDIGYHCNTVTSIMDDIHDAIPSDSEYLLRLKKSASTLSKNDLSIIRSYVYYKSNRLYIPNDATLRTRILHECHDTPTSGHLGKDKTLSLVKRRFYWPAMDSDIVQYVTSCDSCQRNKPSHQSTMGLLQPLPIPHRPWSQVSLDLITALPRTLLGHDAIVVFVDKVTKMVHYVATTTNVTAPQLASIFMHEVIRLHGVPDSLLSDRDPRFTAHFWRSLWDQLGTKLTMSTAYHPQTDGQTERSNRTLEEALRAYVNWRQTDWDVHLSAWEISINNARNSSTGFTPFYLNSGQEIRLPLDGAVPVVGNNPVASERIRRLHQDLVMARDHIERAQKRQAHYADRHRRHVTFAVGDRVLLSTEHLRIVGVKRTPKLTFKYIGPFTVIRVVGSNAYELKLPDNMNLHPVFNISRLKQYTDGMTSHPSREQSYNRPLPIIDDEDGAELFKPERILECRGTGARKRWLVKWIGYPPEENTWEPLSNIGHTDAFDQFEARM
jgi:Integrase zinc binding domain/Retroviral aspartyl protease/Chromo (CHRromatin Organisation MOdifier) domain